MLFALSLTPLAYGLLLQQAMISLLIGFNRTNNEKESRADPFPTFFKNAINQRNNEVNMSKL